MKIEQTCGEEHVYTNKNGNFAISKDVLKEFRKLTEGKVKWERGERAWRRADLRTRLADLLNKVGRCPRSCSLGEAAARSMVFLFLARIVGRIDELDTSGPGEHDLDDRLLVCRPDHNGGASRVARRRNPTSIPLPWRVERLTHGIPEAAVHHRDTSA